MVIGFALAMNRLQRMCLEETVDCCVVVMVEVLQINQFQKEIEGEYSIQVLERLDKTNFSVTLK